MKKKISSLLKSIGNYLKNNYFKVIIVTSLLILITYVFFQFNIFITYDSSWYYSYLRYFNGAADFSNWNIIRGPSFPFVMFIITKIFGDNSFGMLIGLYIIYMLFIVLGYRLLKELYVYSKSDYPLFYYVIAYIVLLIFNPMFLGYSHAMLTEAIVPTFLLIAGIICFKYYKINLKDSRISKYIIYTIGLSLLSLFVYFIKQPFVPPVWMAILITAVLSFINYKSWKDFLLKVSTFIIAFLITLLGVFIFNNIIVSKSDKNASASNMAANGIFGMSYNFKPLEQEEYCKKDFLDNRVFSDKDKNKVSELMENNKDDWCSMFTPYDVMDVNQNYYMTIIRYDNESKSIFDSIGFLVGLWIKYPRISIQSYYENYMVLTDLSASDGVTPIDGLRSDIIEENDDMAYSIYNIDWKNAYWLWDENEFPYPKGLGIYPPKDMESYAGQCTENEELSVIVQLFEPISTTLFKGLMFFSVLIMVYSFIMFIRYKNHLYFIITLFSGMAVTNILFHTVFGTTIDRYIYPTYPLMLLVFIFLFIDKSKINIKKEKNKKKIKKTKKKEVKK